jgi:hypothetical protein
METDSELVLAVRNYMATNPDLKDPFAYAKIPMGDSTLLLEIHPGRGLKVLGVILESDQAETDILQLCHDITCGYLYEDFCPDNDNVEWSYTMGISFHGIPSRFKRLLSYYRIPFGFESRIILLNSEQMAQYFSIEITDYAS